MDELDKAEGDIPELTVDDLHGKISELFIKTTDYHYLSSQVQRNCQQNKMSCAVK
jgi:hypothetical protein